MQRITIFDLSAEKDSGSAMVKIPQATRMDVPKTKGIPAEMRRK